MSGRRKRRASCSPSPSDERARTGPLVLRPARANEPSLVHLPPELVELVIRCAAEDLHVLRRMGYVCRALGRYAGDLLPAVLVDHGIIVQRNARWESIDDGAPQTSEAMWRGIPLTRLVERRLGASEWPEIYPPWRDNAHRACAHLAQPWPTAAYSARLRALADRHARMCMNVFGILKPFGVHLHLQEIEHRLVIMAAIVDGSHAVMQAYEHAAVDHPTIFTGNNCAGLKRGLFNQLLSGRSPIDHVAVRLQTASAVFTAESWQTGVPSALLCRKTQRAQDIHKIVDQAQTPLEAVADVARATFRCWVELDTVAPATSGSAALRASTRLNVEALDLLVAALVAGGHETWLDVFRQASATRAGGVLLYDMALQYGSFTGPPDIKARVFDNLLPHYLDALRACAAARPANAL